MPNVELKAYLDDPTLAHDRLTAMGFPLTRDHMETDTYFQTHSNRLKYRESDSRAARIIGYQRDDKAQLRPSHFQIAYVDRPDKLIFEILSAALGVEAVVSKHRKTYEGSTALVNIDSLFDEYNFIEIEAPCDGPAGESRARAVALDLMTRLGIEGRDIISLSYEHLATVLSGALCWRRQLLPSLGRLVLVDGPSGAGKSTVVSAITSDASSTSYVRRTTSRPRRKTDSADEYEFTSVEEFMQAEMRGEFLESKEFLFDMHYGLRWANIAQALQDSRVGLGVMNLGSIRHVGVVAPEVTTVLITASVDTLRRRISARRTHTDEAIAERLGNAETVQTLADLYDHVLINEDGDLDLTQKALQKLLDGVRRE